MEVSCVRAHKIGVSINVFQEGADSRREQDNEDDGVDDVEDISRIVGKAVVNDALSQVDTTKVGHDAGAIVNVIDVVPAENPNDYERHGSHQFDPAAELSEYDAWILRAEQAEAKVREEVCMDNFLVGHEPIILLECFDVVLLVNEKPNRQPAHQQIKQVLVEQERAVVDLAYEHLAQRHVHYLLIPLRRVNK